MTFDGDVSLGVRDKAVNTSSKSGKGQSKADDNAYTTFDTIIDWEHSCNQKMIRRFTYDLRVRSHQHTGPGGVVRVKENTTGAAPS